MGRPKPVKRQKARNAEYYDMQRTQDDLYKRSLNNQNFIKLMDIIQCDENIMLAYRNIKRNGGSHTPGTDGKTIENLEKLSPEQLSLFCGQHGKCAIAGVDLQIGDIHCHHIIHRTQGGTDRYENLLLVTVDVHRLLHATQEDTIQALLKKLNLTLKQKAKLNYYREKAGLMGV